MDRFDAMRVFTRIVERRSFTQAADDLGLPRSSVTDAIKGLEARLGSACYSGQRGRSAQRSMVRPITSVVWR
ncbi:transcriptional regulator [Bosea sp. BIWAKO-01]|nr:transcriptional regulator [Bosea sp. BIWAKO-01]